uniref:Serpentine receptor class gamma n=1 Tax=Globodera rostochiensis TaxID=31243 RepID=A0A914H868_GLORO
MFDNSSPDIEFVYFLNNGLTNAAFKQFTFVCLFISGTLTMRLLLLARFRPAALHVPELSRALIVYLCFHCAGAILSLPYNAYVLIKFYYGTKSWHTPRTVYTIFWLGQWQNTYTAISPLAVLFLTMERCFIIKLATNPAKGERFGRWMCRASIATLLAAFSASTAIYMAELPLGIDSLNCESVSCVMLKWGNLPQMFFKGSVSFLNIFFSFYFLYTLRTFSAMKKLFGLGLISNVASTCTALDVCCCAIFYSLVFVPPRCLKRANASVSSTNEAKPLPLSLPHQQSTNRSFSLKPMQPNIVLPRD